MNDIPNSQNEILQVERLAAQRYLYSRSKRFLGVQLVSSGPLAIVLSIVVLLHPQSKGIVAVWGCLFVVLDLLLFNRYQKSWREKAAKIQELFDCEVLKLPWNEIKAGTRPIPEEVQENSLKYFRRTKSGMPLENWYPPIVGALPLPIARIVCQRVNCWWDARQRTRYAQWMGALAISVCIVIFCISFAADITASNFVIKVIAPALPALTVGVRQWRDQSEAGLRLETLRQHAEGLWQQALVNPEDAAFTVRSRQLQDEIFHSRKANPPVFDRVYALLQPDSERQMNRSAEILVAEWQAQNKKENVHGHDC